MDNVKEQIIGLIEKLEKYKPENMNDDMGLSKDLGFDSIRLLSLAVEIEETFDIQFEEEFLGKIYTANLKQLFDYVNGLLSKKNRIQ